MPLKLRISERAERDLRDIADWIGTNADHDVAEAYLTRIRERCVALLAFPNRGTPRSEQAGARSIPFERRATILYRVGEEYVDVLGIYHAGREIGGETL